MVVGSLFGSGRELRGAIFGESVVGDGSNMRRELCRCGTSVWWMSSCGAKLMPKSK